jgi:DNA-directed RNA polymerase subunit F
MNLLKEELITNAEAKDKMESLGNPDDMKYEQKNALENLKKFTKLGETETKAVIAELEKNKKLRERQIISIANVLPEDEDDLRAILHKEYTDLTTEEVAQILDTIRNALKPEKKS